MLTIVLSDLISFLSYRIFTTLRTLTLDIDSMNICAMNSVNVAQTPHDGAAQKNMQFKETVIPCSV